MKHLYAGSIVGSGLVLGGIVWNMLGPNAPVVLGLALAVTIIVAIIDWYTEKGAAQ